MNGGHLSLLHAALIVIRKSWDVRKRVSRLLPKGRGSDRGGDPHCSRKLYSGRYIFRGCNAPFANKFAPTGGCVQPADAVLGPNQLPASVLRTRERTCPRRGRHIPRICIAGTTVFANKFAPTGDCVQPADAVLGPHQLPASVRRTWDLSVKGPVHSANMYRRNHRLREQVRTGGCVQPADAVLGPNQLPASVRRTWERTCPGRGRYIPRIGIAVTTVFANKFPTAFGQNKNRRMYNDERSV